MAVTLVLRQPITVHADKRQVGFTDINSHEAVLLFVSHHEMEKWLVELTAKVLGYDRAKRVTGK